MFLRHGNLKSDSLNVTGFGHLFSWISSQLRSILQCWLRGKAGEVEMKPWIKALLIATQGLAMVFVYIPDAAASSNIGPCGYDKYCFYEHAYFNGWNGTSYSNQGWVLTYTPSVSSGIFSDPPNSTINGLDELSSIINNTSYRLCIYNNNAISIQVPAESTKNWLPSGYNDAADAWRLRITGATTCASSI